MKPTVAFVSIGLLIAPLASAGQQKPLEWQEVQKLKPGTEVALTVKTGDTLNVYLLFADETLLVTLKFTPVTKLKRFEQFLVGIGPRWLDILGNPDYKVEQGALRVSQEGLFDGDKKLADLSDLVQPTPRWEVIEILGVVIRQPAVPKPAVFRPAVPKPESFLGLNVFGGGNYFTQAATDTEPAKVLGWGWEAGATLSFGLRWLGINAAVGHQTVAENVSGYHLVAGPRVTSPVYGDAARFFAHALGGLVQTNGTTPSQSSAEWVVGGGLDLMMFRFQFDHVWLTLNGVPKGTDRVFFGGFVPLCLRACRESDGINLSGRKAQ